MPETAAVALTTGTDGLVREVRPFDLDENEYRRWLLTQSIGGSEIGAVLGISDWATAADVFDKKLGLARLEDPNHDMERGTALESIVADIYAQRTGRTLIEEPMRQRAELASYLHASPDRVIAPANDPSHPTMEMAPADGPGVLEIKVPRWRGFDRVRVDGISPSYYAQLQQYLYVKGFAWGSFAVFNADAWELYWFDVLRDDALIDQIKIRGREFWEHHMVPRQRPGTRREPLVIVPPRVGAEAIYCDTPEFVAAVAAVRQTQANYQVMERDYERAKERLRALLGTAEAVVGPGVRITHRPGTRTTYDMDGLYRDHPEIDLSQYRQRTVTRPVLRITFNGS